MYNNRNREVDYGNEGTLHYHGRGVHETYDADFGSHKKKKRKGGIFGVFRNNPSLMIILIDIIVIVLVLTIVLPFIGKKSSEENFEGYELSLHGFVYEETVTLSLVVTALPGEESYAEVENERLAVRFSLKAESGEELSRETLEVVPPERGESKIVRIELTSEGPEEVEYIAAEVHRGDEIVSLQKRPTK
ncbi:MAG: hypothetical protein ACLFNZ_06565 [Spirochaetaceae bacterium]